VRGLSSYETISTFVKKSTLGTAFLRVRKCSHRLDIVESGTHLVPFMRIILKIISNTGESEAPSNKRSGIILISDV